MKFLRIGQRVVPHAIAGAPALRRLARWPWHRLVPLTVGLYCALLLVDDLQSIELVAVTAAVGDVSAGQWLAALGATAVSFWALARYDVHMHAHCRTGVTPRRAACAGACAIAISQVTGLAAVVAGLIRWKLLRPMYIGRVATITLSVSVIFLLGWGLTLSLTALLPASLLPIWITPLALCALIGLLVLSVVRPRLPGSGRSLPIPSILHILRMSGLAILDLIATGVAFYVLVPAEHMVDFAIFFPIFLLAFGAGLYSGTPGGVGPFELSLLTLLPQVPAPEFLAAILVFRIVYYALPACIALLFLVWDHVAGRAATNLVADRPEPARSAPLVSCSRAEAALVRHNGGAVRRFSNTFWATVDTGQTLVCLLDPLDGSAALALPDLRAQAKAEGRMALLYRLSSRSAAALKAAGWRILRLSDEARLRPEDFDPDTPGRRQLRRKLRAADRAGISIEVLDAKADHDEMARVARSWRAAHGPERGVSMGRFSADCIADQQLFGAFHNDRLVAFISLHSSHEEMCLDLMRHAPDAPDGTMHSLVHAAIEAARRAGIPWVSLAAAPSRPDVARGKQHSWLLRMIAEKSQGNGLRRFKESFAPIWLPRYVAAPGILHLLVALLDMSRAVHWPDRIHRSSRPSS